MRHFLFLAATIVIATSLNAQRPVVVGSAQPDSISRRAQPPSSAEAQRLERLSILADVWGKLYLLHPKAATGSHDWLRLLVTAIPAVESSSTPSQLASAINGSLFAPLDDAAAFAQPVRRAGSRGLWPAQAQRSPALPAARMATAGVLYIDLTDPATPRPREFPSQLAAALRSGRSNEVAVLILDLRWKPDLSPSTGGRAGWLTLFLDSARTVGPRVSREREGWSEAAASLDGWYTQRWRLDPPAEFRPAQSPVGTARGLYPPEEVDSLLSRAARMLRVPTVIIVNNASLPVYEPYLDAMQSRRDVAVVYERTGGFWLDSDQTYGDDVQVRFHLAPVLSRDGALGFAPDIVLEGPAAFDSIATIARHALRARSSRAMPRPRFDHRIAAAPRWSPSNSSPSRQERIAGLISLWTVMRYLNPHVTMATVDWSRMLPAWIARVEAAEGIPAYYRALNEILATLRDGHARAAHSAMGFFGPFSIPAIVLRVEGRPVVAELGRAADSTLRAGDEILAIDGKSIGEVEAAFRPIVSARDVDDFMWGQSTPLRSQQRDAPIELTVTDAGRPRVVRLRRSVVAAESYDTVTVRRLPNGIGYVNLRAIPPTALLPIMDSLHRTSAGIVLDLRGYPVLSAALDELPRRFIERPIMPRGRRGGNPLLVVNQGRIVQSLSAIPAVIEPDPVVRYTKPTVLLVDGRAGSAAETIALMLETAPNVTVVGSTTAGVTGGPTTISMPGGGVARFTGELMVRPDGEEFFTIGIVPSVTAKPTISGLRSGRDEVLERGVEVLRQRLSGTSEMRQVRRLSSTPD